MALARADFFYGISGLKIISLQKIMMVFLLMVGFFCQEGWSAEMGNAQQKMATLQKNLDQQRQQVQSFELQVTELNGAIRLFTETKTRLEQEKADALKKWRAKQQLMTEYTDISDAQERKIYTSVKQNLDAATDELATLRQKLAMAEQGRNSSVTKQTGLEKELMHLKAKLDEERFAILQKQMEQEKTVEARGEAGCGSETVSACKDLALQDALRQATEQGSAVLVDSSTDVVDGRLEKDLIRSRVQAVILRHEILDKGWAGDTSYYYKIRAVVKGQVSPSLREQFLGQTNKGGKIEKLTQSKLAVCRDMLAGNYLTRPETRSGQPPQNALNCFKNVRSLDPGNREAIQGLGGIEKRYKELAESAISKGKEEKARSYIERIRKVNPESLVAMELEDRLAQAAPLVSYAVTIKTTPSDASVEFTNINREYKDGVQLESGRYDLKVSRQGYKTFTGYVTVEKDSVWTVELESEQKKQHGQFVDNGNGTVTHTATGLILLKNANCFGTKTWDVAKSSAASLKSGSCGLTDGSVAGDWRLPTFPGATGGYLNGEGTPSIVGQAGELEILWAAKSNPAFTVDQAKFNNYWSSTTNANSTSNAWVVSLDLDYVSDFSKTFSYYVWPVRVSKKSSQAKKQHGQFVDNGDGTITDTKTGLVGLKDANCFGRKNWNDAMSAAAHLASGSCGLTDGSSSGDWRLPKKDELHFLIGWKKSSAFTGVQASDYWSSTTLADLASVGSVYFSSKSSSYYVWPVRGGH